MLTPVSVIKPQMNNATPKSKEQGCLYYIASTLEQMHEQKNKGKFSFRKLGGVHFLHILDIFTT